MGETSSQIKHQIDEERRSLGENLSELEARAKEAMDWRARMRQHPMAALGIAVGAGAIIGALSVRSQTSYDGEYSERTPPETGRSAFSEKPAWASRKRKIAGTLDTLADAFIGVATNKVKDLLGGILPGFSSHYERAERERRDGPEYS